MRSKGQVEEADPLLTRLASMLPHMQFYYYSINKRPDSSFQSPILPAPHQKQFFIVAQHGGDDVPLMLYHTERLWSMVT